LGVGIGAWKLEIGSWELTMRSLMQVAVITATVLMGACAGKADGPPDIQVDRTACAHCTMLISEPRYAAAYQVEGAGARVFDDIGCLLDALDKEGKAPARFWFMDAADSRWIDGHSAIFVRSEQIRTPMSGGITAYRDLAAAEAAAAKHAGVVVRSFDGLRTGKGK